MQAIFNIARRTASLAAARSSSEPTSNAAALALSRYLSSESLSSAPPAFTRSLSSSPVLSKRALPIHAKKGLDVKTDEGEARMRAMFLRFGGSGAIVGGAGDMSTGGASGLHEAIKMTNEDYRAEEARAAEQHVRMSMKWFSPRKGGKSDELESPSPSHSSTIESDVDKIPAQENPPQWHEDETLHDRLARLQTDIPSFKQGLNDKLSRETMEALAYIRGEKSGGGDGGFSWGSR